MVIRSPSAHYFSMDVRYSIITSASDIDFLRGKTSQFRDLNIRYSEKTLEYLKKHLADADSLYLLAKRGEEFAGFCSIDSDWWEQGYFFLREIFVQPEFQKQGMGCELMQRCIAHAKTMGAIGVVTETAHENLPMRQLCTKCGFIEWENPQWKQGVTFKIMF